MSQPPQYPYGSPVPFYPPSVGPPKHPKATTSLIIGIIALASILMCCGVLLFLAPVAWVMGAKTVKEIDASGGALAGRSDANTGRILGIVGTIAIPFVLVGAVLYFGAMSYDVLWEIRHGEFHWIL